MPKFVNQRGSEVAPVSRIETSAKKRRAIHKSWVTIPDLIAESQETEHHGFRCIGRERSDQSVRLNLGRPYESRAAAEDLKTLLDQAGYLDVEVVEDVRKVK